MTNQSPVVAPVAAWVRCSNTSSFNSRTAGSLLLLNVCRIRSSSKSPDSNQRVEEKYFNEMRRIRTVVQKSNSVPEVDEEGLVGCFGVVESSHGTVLRPHDPSAQSVHQILSQIQNYVFPFFARVAVFLSCKRRTSLIVTLVNLKRKT